VGAWRPGAGVRPVRPQPLELFTAEYSYNGGHIDGAVLWNAYQDLLQPNYKIVEAEAFAALLSRSGIRPGTRVVFYGYAASLGFWCSRTMATRGCRF
jgi:3-mercaptopyruvate sulfurtransferase SseA